MVFAQTVTCFKNTCTELAADLQVGHMARLHMPRNVDPAQGRAAAVPTNPVAARLEHLGLDLVVQLCK